MNIWRPLLFSVKREIPYHIFKRCHSTALLTGTVSNDNGRLRFEEETYCNRYSTPLKQPYSAILEKVYKSTEKNFENPHMMVCETQAKMLHQLVGLLRPARVLEIGGFTGYSAIAMGSALSKKATLTSLELDPKHVETARHNIELADLQNVVSFKEGPADDRLLELAKLEYKYDFIFLDADKRGYINYFDIIMEYDMLSDNGVLLADNVLLWGQVHKQDEGYKPSNKEETHQVSKNLIKRAKTVHAFNQHVAKDIRVEVVILPIFDGISIIRKKIE